MRSVAKEKGILDVSLILNKSHSGTSSLAGSAVVEGSSRQVEWKGGTFPGSGCLPAGMGRTMWRFAIGRPVYQQGAVHAHKLPETLGESVCSENICQAEPEHPHLLANGRHNRCGVRQQNGGHTLKHPIEHGVQPLAVVPSEGHLTVCRVPPRNSQPNSRCRILNLLLLSQMAIASFGIQEDKHLPGPCQVDLFATRLNDQLLCYISWCPDPFATSTDTF